MHLQDDTLFLRDEALAAEGFVHGFSIRTGGVSRGAFDSLNLGAGVGDDGAAVQENLARLAAAAGFAPSAFRTARQVHGAEVILLGSDGQEEEEGDALMARERGLVPAVRTADCVPILLAHPDTRAVAAVHAGWRGTLAEVVLGAVAALEAAGAPARELRAAIGPAIGPCCYQTAPEVAARFASRLGAAVISGRQVDLRHSNRLLLQEAGVHPERIAEVGGCTSCEAGLFFSHRRDRGHTGRHLSFIRCG